MYLKSLEMTGFKSFAEAKVEFPSGITAVVGPNGTGKSNIVDAILWVLGEQSTKTLRSETMEDVIFNGTETRKPLGMAEVTLILSGLDRHRLQGVDQLPHHLGEFHEVMVTRRLYRNGDSEYLINKALSRLKDVRSLLLDTRAGSKGHTIIEQGRIDHILNASPLERRELIEETAGIVRYKKQKAEALRKLDATQHNLLRVRDIVSEVRRQLNALERQARQARTYRNLQEEARTIEIRLLVHEHLTLSRRQALILAELATLDTEESGRVAEQARVHAELEATRMRMLTGDEAMRRIREELHAVEQHQAQALTAAEVERGKRDLYEGQRIQAEDELARLVVAQEQAATGLEQLQRDLAEVETRLADGDRGLAALETSLRELEARQVAETEHVEAARQRVLELMIQQTTGRNLVSALDERRQEANRRALRLSEEHAGLVGQHTQSLTRLQELGRERHAGEALVADLRREREVVQHEHERIEGELREAEQRLVRRQEELAAIESSWTALRSVVREEMGYGREGDEDGTSVRGACRGVRAALAEWMDVPPGLERALEAVLGERVRAWLVEGPGEARDAVAFLKSRGLGRGAFVPVRARYGDRAAEGGEASWWPRLSGAAGVIGRAADLVRTTGESPEALQWLLDGVVIVHSVDVALGLWHQGLWTAPDGPILVSTDGEVLDQAGVLVGGSSGESGGLLQRRGEVQRLEAQQGALRATLEEERRMRETLAQRVDRLRGEMVRLDAAIRDGELRSLGLAKDQEGVTQQTDGLSKRIDLLELERCAVEDEQRRIEEESAEVQGRLGRVGEEQAEQERTFAELTALLQRLDEENRSLQQRVTMARLEAAAQRARLDHLAGEFARVGQEQAERQARSVAVAAQRDTLAESAAQSRAEQERNEALCRELDQRAREIRAQLVAAQETHAQDGGRARELEQGLDVVRERLNGLRDRRTGFEVQRAEIATQLAGVEQTLTGTYQLSLDEAVTQADEREPVAPSSPGEVEGQDAGGAPIPPDPIQALREQLQRIRERVHRMGAINLAAIEEHQELESRHTFLSAQEADLTTSIASLKEIIQKINRTTKQLFLQTFNELQEKFGEVFGRLFPGGRAELVLVDPEPVEGDEQPKARHEEHGVDVVAQPPGKRLKSITMLSGGEKTLTAMALIFASFLIRPTPFCVLDEIDAPLDEENIGRFTGVLTEMAERAQFLVITHNKRTMNVADSLFGVTMEEPGVSKIVSVQIADLQPA